MPDILTITLNPSVDLAATVAKVVAGPKLYTSQPRVDPGGGGVNVARAIRKLGGEATALVATGGAMGDRLLGLLTDEGVKTLAVPVRGETRQSLAVTDESTGEQYRFSLPGETLGPDDAARLLDAIASAAPQDGYVVLSGGVAPGLGDDFLQFIQARIAHRTTRLIVDTSRALLQRLIESPKSPLMLLRVNQKEAAQAANTAMQTLEDSLAFARRLVESGVAQIVVTGRGAEGSVMVTQDAHYFCSAPTVTVRSKIGAGDSFVGAMTQAFARGETPDEALRWGVAAASAAVGTEGTELCSQAVTEMLFQQCTVTQV